MYSVQSSSTLARNLTARGIKGRVGGTVLLLGTCSLLTDISSEMVSAILPLYLVFTLGFTPLQYGVIDGLYQGAAALINLASGYVGDRLRRHKVVAATGYGLSALCKLGLALIGGAGGRLSALILLDRTGKGIRTAPRDAMISLTAPKRELGFAFGVHRAMDTAGAMIGPLVGVRAAGRRAERLPLAVPHLVLHRGPGLPGHRHAGAPAGEEPPGAGEAGP